MKMDPLMKGELFHMFIISTGLKFHFLIEGDLRTWEGLGGDIAVVSVGISSL